MYLMTTKNEYMAGLTKYLIIRVPHSNDSLDRESTTVEECRFKVGHSVHTCFDLPSDGKAHSFDVVLVHGDFNCLFVPAESIRDASVHNLNHANTYAHLIIPAVTKYIEACRVSEQAEADTATQSTGN